MTDYRRILALVNDRPRSAVALALAARLARAHGASLSALHAVESLGSAAYMTPEAAGVALQWASDEERRRRDAAAQLVAAVSVRSGLPISLEHASGAPVDAVLQHACGTDLLVLGQRDPRHPDGTASGFAEKVLVGAGCPLLFVPCVDSLALQADGAPQAGTHVIVAWSPRRESVRALRDALPLLRAARRVELMRFLRHGEDDRGSTDATAAWLQAHGVKALTRLEHLAAPPLHERIWHASTVDVPISDALLSYAADTGADLIVMGGYGHARAWELAMGGVTRTMLQSMTVPVLMSH